MEQIVLSPSLFDLAQGDPEVLETGILRRAESERRVEGLTAGVWW